MKRNLWEESAMSDLFKKAISLGVGLTIVSKEKVEKVVEELVKRGELAPSESRGNIGGNAFGLNGSTH